MKVARLGINIISASGLRGADRNGQSDPYCVVRCPGRPKSKYQTKVIQFSLNPVWRESCEIEEFFAGDELEFAVYDKDVSGRECLGKISIPQASLTEGAEGFAGDLFLHDEKHPHAGQEGPTLRVKVVVLENFDPDGRLQAKAVRGMEDSDEEPDPDPVHETCRDLDNFEASARPVPRLGNFWMTPRGDMQKASHDGGSTRRQPESRGSSAQPDLRSLR